MSGPRRSWRLGAGPRRATIEAGSAALALAVPLLLILAGIPAAESRSGGLVLGAFYAGLLGVVAGALRLRRGDGPWLRQLQQEARAAVGLVAAVVAAVMLAAVAAAPRASAATDFLPALVVPIAVASVGAAAAGAAYPILRGLVLVWPAWDRYRRTHILWALTHAQFLAGLALVLGLAVLLAIPAFLAGAGPAGIAPDTDTLLARVVLLMLPAATALLLLGVGAIVAVLPPAALISYLVLRPATQRLQDLAAATGALRAGDLTARVPVRGEDEIARLQADFNAMAADLERAMRDLAAERDTVARLLADRRALVVAVSHDLRTPVATLRGYLDSARDHWTDAPPPELRHDLEIMAGETERLQRLIDDLFTLARADTGGLPLTLGPTDASALLHRSAAAAAPLAWARGRVAVLAEAPPELPLVRADPDRLEQVIHNLVANAVRHTPPGGLVLLTAAVADGAVCLQVRDTGEGIPPADLPHIFERFYRASAARERDGGGGGLGLALVKELTEAMGGSVTVESTPGAGSCFTVRLPVA